MKQRFVWMHKSDAKIEAGFPPTRESIARMGAFLQAMASAGVYEAGEGLRPNKEGVRVRFSRGTRTVTHGPFVGSNELVATMALVRAHVIDEAIEWASRIAALVGDSEFYIGPVVEPWDLGLVEKPEDHTGRFLILKKSDAQSEAGTDTDPRPVFDEMRRAGVLLAAERLEPSVKGTRLTVSKERRTVVDGPFTESKELIAGYCIVRVASREAALSWANHFCDVLRQCGHDDRVQLDLRGLSDGR
jgi:hypothetical protein